MKRHTINILVGPQGKRPLGGPRRRWKDDMRMNPTEIWREGVVWMHLAQNRDQWMPLVHTVMKIRIP